MAKILAEYGRCLEELFVYLYAMAGIAERLKLDGETRPIKLKEKSGPVEPEGNTVLKKNVFFERLIYYSFSDLKTFIDSLEKSDIRELLLLEKPALVATELDMPVEKIEMELSTVPERIWDFRGQYLGDVRHLYNKLKHPFLILSKVPHNIGDDNYFAIFQNSTDTKNAHFNFTPIELSIDSISTLRENAMNAYSLLGFLIKCFIASNDIRVRQLP